MTRHIRIVRDPDPAAHTPLAGVFRWLILIGVWILVGLAGLSVWSRLAA